MYLQTALLTPFCPQRDGAILVRMSLDHRDPRPEIATGTYRVQLFRREIAEVELQARAEKHESEMRQRSVRYVCGHCAKVLVVCRLANDTRCTERYLACLQTAALTQADCERGDVAPPPKKAPWDI